MNTIDAADTDTNLQAEAEKRKRLSLQIIDAELAEHGDPWEAAKTTFGWMMFSGVITPQHVLDDMHAELEGDRKLVCALLADLSGVWDHGYGWGYHEGRTTVRKPPKF
jgi:hypothetical protein